MNRKTIAIAALSLIAALPVAASAAGPKGFDAAPAAAAADRAPQGFGTPRVTTVEDVLKNGADDEYVALRGRFTAHVRGDKYEFQDEAGGVMTAELDADRDWSMVRKDAKVEIRAKIDRDWDTTELEVKSARPL